MFNNTFYYICLREHYKPKLFQLKQAKYWFYHKQKQKQT